MKMSNTPAKYEALIKQYLCSILDISEDGQICQICPGLNANEIQIPHDKHHEVSSLVKSFQNTLSSVKYEVI